MRRRLWFRLIALTVVCVTLGLLLYGTALAAQGVTDTVIVSVPIDSVVAPVPPVDPSTGGTLSDLGIASALSVAITAILIRWFSWFNAFKDVGRALVFVGCCVLVVAVERAFHLTPSDSILAAVPGAWGLFLHALAAALGGTALFHTVKSQVRSA